MTKYYLVEGRATGPDDDGTRTVWISPYDGDACLDGKIVITDGAAFRTHGAYDTIEDARDAMSSKWSTDNPVPQEDDTYRIRGTDK